MSASIHRYQEGDPAGATQEDGYGRDDWPMEFMRHCRAGGFPVDTDPALRMRLWSLWKEARGLI